MPGQPCPYWRLVFGNVVQCGREAHGVDPRGHVAQFDDDGIFEVRWEDQPEEGSPT